MQKKYRKNIEQNKKKQKDRFRKDPKSLFKPLI